MTGPTPDTRADLQDIETHVRFLRANGGGSAGYTADLLEASGHRIAELEAELSRSRDEKDKAVAEEREAVKCHLAVMAEANDGNSDGSVWQSAYFQIARGEHIQRSSHRPSQKGKINRKSTEPNKQDQ